MQQILLTKPYKFIPPVESSLWVSLLHSVLPSYLSRAWGLERVEFRGIEKLQGSISAGHGVLIAPNHCRPCDPMLMGMLSREAQCQLFIMASAHLFYQSRFQRWLLPRIGAFSIYREGLDRAALDTAIGILDQGKRPLLIFPEGIVSRTNDNLNPLQDGISMIVKGGLKRRLARGAQGGIAVHPVAIRYFFHGDLQQAVRPVLTEIEGRLTWQPQTDLSTEQRIRKVGGALLSLKELEYLGEVGVGEIPARLERLVSEMLLPLEQEWLKGPQSGSTIARVKKLRGAILPEMVKGELGEAECERRWRQLTVCYYAQVLSLYPPYYITETTPLEHILETVERFEEDLTDSSRIHRPMSAVIEVREPLILPATDEGTKRSGEVNPFVERELVNALELLKGARPSLERAL